MMYKKALGKLLLVMALMASTIMGDISSVYAYNSADRIEESLGEIQKNTVDEYVQSRVQETDNNKIGRTNNISEENSIDTDVIGLDQDGNIASGSYGDVTWVIDSEGILTVKGTGEFRENDYDLPPWIDYANNIKKAVVELKDIQHLSMLFYHCKNLVEVDFSKTDTSKVTDMQSMFSECQNLITLDLSSFDTSNVTLMGSMFSECDSLISVDLSSFDTSNVIMMDCMFRGCISIKTLDISNFNTSKVTSMSSMFDRCVSLTSLDLSSLNTSNVENMQSMFQNCSALTFLDLSNFNTKKVKWMQNLFEGCENLISLNISSFDTNNVISMGFMFCGCKCLESLDISNFDISNSLSDMDFMFSGCDNLKSLDLSRFGWFGVSMLISESLESITISNKINRIPPDWHIPSLTDVYFLGTPEEFEKIDFSDSGEAGNMIKNCKNVHYIDDNGTDKNIKVVGKADRDIYYWDDYSTNDFNLNITVGCIYDHSAEVQPVYNNVSLEIRLDNSLSFGEADMISYHKEEIGSLSASNSDLGLKPFSLPVFIKNSTYKKSFSVIAVLSSDDFTTKTFTIDIPVKKYEIKTYSTNPSGLMGVNQAAVFLPVLVIDGKEQKNEQGWKFDVENDQIVSVDEVKETDYGFGVRIKSLSQGFTYLDILHVPSGKKLKLPITVSESKKTYDVSELIALKKVVYNKIFIENCVCNKTNNGSSVSFDAYNYLDHMGAVEVYDANGRLQKMLPIKKSEAGWQTDIQEVVESGVTIFLAHFNGDFHKDESKLYCTHTHIDTFVPEGGFIIISNDVDESLAAGIYNLIDISYTLFGEGLKWSGKILKGDLDKIKEDSFNSVSGKIINFLIENNYDKTLTDAYMKKLSKSISKSLSKDVLAAFSCQFLTESEDYLGELNINLQEEASKSIVKLGYGKAEDFFYEAAGPAGKTLEGLFSANKVLSVLSQLICLGRTSGLGEIVITTKNDNEVKIDDSVVVTYEDGKDIEDADIIVIEITDKATNKYIFSEIPNVKEFKLWNISLYRESFSVQPDGMITIRIPIPNEYDIEKCRIYRQETDGQMTDMNAYYENGCLVFKTSHLSYYALCVMDETESDEETKKNTEMNTGIPGSAITAKKLDISKAFDIPAEVKTKFIIKDKSQKKLASVSSKGLLTAKKPGTVTVTLQQKDGKTWKDVQSISYEIVVPKGSTVNVGTAYYEGQIIDLNALLKDNDVFHPTTWTTKTKSNIASIDCDTGMLTVGAKNGTATVNAVYGTGKNARSVKITVKINHKSVDISDAFGQTNLKKKYIIKDKNEKKLASVSTKGLLTVKKNGSVTVTLQVKDGKTWKDVESRSFQLTNPITQAIY